jgi:hypothetical protein
MSNSVAGGRHAGKYIVVCPSGTGDFTTIGAALEVAQPGALMKVRLGQYAEQVVPTRPVQIEGPESGTAAVEVSGSP